MKAQNGSWRWQEDGLTVTRTTAWSGPGCHNGCGILVYSQGNRVVKVEGDPESPFNEGRLCVRCLVLPKVVHHPDRLQYPLKRVGERGEGRWERITWDEAYGHIVERVKRIRDEYGPETIAAAGGTARNINIFTLKLCLGAFGSPNMSGFLSGTACFIPRVRLLGLTQGGLSVADCSQMFADRFDNPRWQRPECIVIWGNDPIVSNPDSFMGFWIVECLKRGSRLIVVDPRLTWIASRAEVWLQLRPGTDAALALGMLNVIIDEKLYDREFVDQWTEGFDKLSQRVREYPPERVERISGVPRGKIIAAARLYATSKPAAIQWGVAVDQSQIGMSTILGIASLWGVTGNIDVPGGNILNRSTQSFEVPPRSWARGDLSPEAGQKVIKGAYPMDPRAHPDTMVETMITGRPYPIKMLWLQGNNPLACQGADPRRTYQAIRNVDFVVGVDLFMTPTLMAGADIVLPAASALERDSIRIDSLAGTWWGPLRAINKVVQVGECRSDEEIVLELGRRLNPRSFPWANVEEMLDWLLKESGMTFRELREKGDPVYLPFEYKKYEKGLLRPDGQPGFNTRTGKFMLSVPEFEEAGLDGLPYYEEPPESPVSTPELAREYPLVLTTGARSWAFFHSEHRQIPEMREINPEPVVEIHPEMAAGLGIGEGDWVWIENRHGRCKQKARLTATIRPDVVNAQHGWWFPEKPGPEPSLFGVWESNPSLLLAYGLVGPSGYCAPYKCLICRVYRAEEG